MTSISGVLHQRSISSGSLSERDRVLLNYIILIFLGLVLATLDYFIKIPIQLPGKKGIIWIAFLVSARFLSREKHSGTAVGAGAAMFTMTAGLWTAAGTVDWMVYLLVGFVLDLMHRVRADRGWIIYLVPLVCGLLHVLKPLAKYPLSMLLFVPENSLALGMMRPVLTHIIFGILGALVGILAAKAFVKEEKTV
jgi:hypothetical protein